jgi:Tfp pilus assembly protein PilV
MAAWIVRLLLLLAAPIAALFVSRDALNFGVIETLIAIVLIALVVLAAALWTLRRKLST